MTLPALLFGILISTIYGVVFHLFRGGGAGRLILYVILAWVGFWAGQLIADQIGINLINIGPLHMGIATLGSWLFLGIGYWLSLVEIKDKQSNT